MSDPAEKETDDDEHATDVLEGVQNRYEVVDADDAQLVGPQRVHQLDPAREHHCRRDSKKHLLVKDPPVHERKQHMEGVDVEQRDVRDVQVVESVEQIRLWSEEGGKETTTLVELLKGVLCCGHGEEGTHTMQVEIVPESAGPIFPMCHPRSKPDQGHQEEELNEAVDELDCVIAPDEALPGVLQDRLCGLAPEDAKVLRLGQCLEDLHGDDTRHLQQPYVNRGHIRLDSQLARHSSHRAGRVFESVGGAFGCSISGLRRTPLCPFDFVRRCQLFVPLWPSPVVLLGFPKGLGVALPSLLHLVVAVHVGNHCLRRQCMMEGTFLDGGGGQDLQELVPRVGCPLHELDPMSHHGCGLVGNDRRRPLLAFHCHPTCIWHHIGVLCRDIQYPGATVVHLVHPPLLPVPVPRYRTLPIRHLVLWPAALDSSLEPKPIRLLLATILDEQSIGLALELFAQVLPI
mmetsp:Transcript_162197/g.520175  ORF Transcript_162197/g.520175 Transcript_162197/m.520175 type:complete len:459 (-) Transcript_162197:956-2332(-)